jgi:hypothetical protein
LRDALLQENMELTCRKKLILYIIIVLFFKLYTCDCNFNSNRCNFLGSKARGESPPLNNVLIVSYKIFHKNELENFHYLLSIDWFEKYKQQVIQVEQLLIATLDFELTNSTSTQSSHVSIKKNSTFPNSSCTFDMELCQ